MKNLPENLFLKGRLILLKAIVFLFLTCFTFSCVESIVPEDAKKKIQNHKKENEDPENPGGPQPPMASPKADTCFQK